MEQPTPSPFASNEDPKKPSPVAKNYYPYAPDEMVCHWAVHKFGHKLFIIRRLASTIDKEAYQARYLNDANELVIDVFYPEEFILEEVD